jgi:hypothetical protein
VTSDEREQVRLALAKRGCQQGAAVRSLGSAIQLHQFVLNYNVNDGVLPVLAVAEHPACDAGTALFLFWQFEDLVFQAEARERSRARPPEWNAAAVLDELERRFNACDFRTAELRFDPLVELGLSRTQRTKLLEAGLAESRLQAVGLTKVAREWLL